MTGKTHVRVVGTPPPDERGVIYVDLDGTPRVGECVRMWDESGSPRLWWVDEVLWDPREPTTLYLTHVRPKRSRAK